MAVQGEEVFGEEEDKLLRHVMVAGAAFAALPPSSYCCRCRGVACLVCVCVCGFLVRWTEEWQLQGNGPSSGRRLGDDGLRTTRCVPSFLPPPALPPSL